MRRKEREVLFKIIGLRRRCSCGKTFYCSGNCPEGRWISSHGKEDIRACFCKDCLGTSNFGPAYIKKRLKHC